MIDRWQHHAACAGVDPEVFFPHKTDAEGREIALEYCRRCPVVDECLEYACSLPYSQYAGIYGGMTIRDRKRYTAQRNERQDA